MKKIIKNIKVVKKIYNAYESKINKYLFYNNPVALTKKIYKKKFGKVLNLDSPKTFNEKLQWLKLYNENDLVIKCADKYTIREYVLECDCEEILNELYGVYSNIEEIDFESLPNKFVLKCTQGCGYNIICKNKNSFNINKNKLKLQEWLNTTFGIVNCETHYSKMTPKVICEKYLEGDREFGLIDYKIYCFNGKAIYTLVCLDRENEVKKEFYDIEWNKVKLRKDSSDLSIKKPSSYDEMLKYAEILSKPFPFVRVDFYEVDKKPILGEMTFTPAACLSDEYTQEGEYLLGSLIELPKRYDNKSKV